MERVLHAGGFGEHAGAFQKEDVTVDVLPLLNDKDLRQLGVARMGQRKRMKELFSNPHKVVKMMDPDRDGLDWNQLPEHLLLHIATYLVDDIVDRIGRFDIVYEEQLEKEALDLGEPELREWMQEHYGTDYTDRGCLNKEEMEHVRGIESGGKLLCHLKLKNIDEEDQDQRWSTWMTDHEDFTAYCRFLTEDEIANGDDANPEQGGMWTLHPAICKDTDKLYLSLEDDDCGGVWSHVGKMVSHTFVSMPKNHRAVTCSFWILCECFAFKTNAELFDHVWVQENSVWLGGEYADAEFHTAPAVMMSWKEA